MNKNVCVVYNHISICTTADCINYSWWLKRILLVVFVLGLAYSITYGSVMGTAPSYNILAITGDTLDCDKLLSRQKIFWSEVLLSQHATDTVNDNPNGLSMRIQSFKKTEIRKVRKVHNYTGSTEIVVKKDFKPFLIPNGYYAYPIYVWVGSNITVQVNLSNYRYLPKMMIMYLILGDKNYNTFAANPLSIPQYERQLDLLCGSNSTTYRMTTKYNGYYYIVIKVNTDHEIHFSARVKFDYYSVASDDLNFSQAKTLSEVGSTVRLHLDISNNQLVLCAVDSVTDPSDYSIHIQMKYGIRHYITVPIPVIVVLSPLLLIMLYKLKKVYLIYSIRKKYEPI